MLTKKSNEREKGNSEKQNISIPLQLICLKATSRVFQLLICINNVSKRKKILKGAKQLWNIYMSKL